MASCMRACCTDARHMGKVHLDKTQGDGMQLHKNISAFKSMNFTFERFSARKTDTRDETHRVLSCPVSLLETAIILCVRASRAISFKMNIFKLASMRSLTQ